MLWESIGYNLRNLASFSGRESRRRFWPYAGIVIALCLMGFALVMVPEINASMARMHQFGVEHPELVTETVGPGSYSISVKGSHPELMPDIGSAIGWMGLVMLAAVALLAAGAARRLHDSNRGGWWGLLPFPFLIFSMIAMPRMFADFGGPDTDMTLFFAIFLSNLLYNVLLIAVIVLLALKGTAGPNRFGDRPD